MAQASHPHLQEDVEMNSKLRILLGTAPIFAGFMVLASLPAVAQRQAYTYISYVGSDVALISTADDDSTARINTPVLAGDRLETPQTSRAEIVLADGNILRIDSRSAVRFDRLARTYETDDLRNLIYLESGAICLENRSAAEPDEATRIDTGDATIVFPDRGLLRVDTGRRGTEIYVASGRAEIMSRKSRAVVRAGEYAYVTAADEIETDRWDFPRDRFTRFVDERRDRSQADERPSYIAADYDYDYAVSGLADSGSWTYLEDAGEYGWRPAVGSDWSPYSNGYWRYTPAGLNWVSYDPWGWLVHHYGSWTFQTSLGWCWLPGSYYSPAWVYWNYMPSYVGWCPMGYYSHHGAYMRAAHGGHGREGRGGSYAHLQGRVDVSQIDRHGWNYVSAGRVGGRFGRQDVIRGDRLDLRGETSGLVSTTPLRVDRVGRGSAGAAVQEAVRRAGAVPGSGTREGGRSTHGQVDQNLTSILRRESNPSPAVQDELRRNLVRTGQDPAYRALPAESIASGRRTDASGTASRPGSTTGSVAPRPGRTSSGSLAPESRDAVRRRVETGSMTTRPGATGPAVRSGETLLRENWRDGSSSSLRTIPSDQNRSSAGSNLGSSSRTSARPSQGSGSDDGWRSPTGLRGGKVRVIDNSSLGSTSTAPETRGPMTGGFSSPTRDDSRSGSSSRSAEPSRSEPVTEPRRDSQQPRADAQANPRTSESWRTSSGSATARAPRQDTGYTSPRSQGSTRSYETSRPRTDPSHDSPRVYESSRPQTAPRNYEAPRSLDSSRSGSSPRVHEAPRSYDAPRPAYSAPSASSGMPRMEPRPAYSAPSSGGNSGMPRMESRPASPPAQAPSSGSSRGGSTGHSASRPR
jgi:hypothetical protein